MFTTRLTSGLGFIVIVLAGLGLLHPLPLNAVSPVQQAVGYIEEVRSLDTNDLGLLNPAGLAFSPDANVFFVLDARTRTQADIVTMTPYEELVGSVSVSGSLIDPINVTFDDQASRLLLLDTGANELIEIKAGPDGLLDPSPDAITRFEVESLGLQDPRGMAVDPVNGHLLILDSGALQIVRVEPDSRGGFDGAAALTEGRISRVDLKPAGLGDPRGLAFNPGNGHLYLLSPSQKALYELTQTGQVVATLDVSPFKLVDTQGLVFALSGDLTDDPSIIHLYGADTGLRAGLGRVIEFSLAPPVPISLTAAAAAPVDRVTLVRTALTSKFSPSSPDPSGLAYLSNSGTLLISDGEVEEMPIWAGKNVWETSLSGSVVRTQSTMSFSDEPTGIAYNPSNGHLFFTDDTSGYWVFEKNPGKDGRLWTADDTITSFKTANFGDIDPEGITYNTWNGHLFIADGVNAEVYEVAPGANGKFDGVAPSGDDRVTHFDTAGLGLRDPESVEFNSDNGHLYILSDKARKIGETATDGTLIRYIDIASLGTKAAAGLVYAPSSTKPGQKSFYIVARGVDNNSNPNENDGKLYEVSFPPLEPATNQPPVVNAGLDQSITLHNIAALVGTVSDDGLPNPPGTLTTTWSKASGPGTVIFATPNAVRTTASFSAAGTYVLRLIASDGALSASDDVAITVLPGGTVTSLEVRVPASSDDAEEKASGSVSLTSTDLELVYDRSNQTVGMRFVGVSIPKGATIVNAYVQFQADEVATKATKLTIRGQAIDNAPTFIATSKNISSRKRTAAAVSWSPVGWPARGAAGAQQRTPSLTSIIQELVNRTSWSAGNSLVIVITGTGERVAEAYDGEPAAAPLLHVEYAWDAAAVN